MSAFGIQTPERQLSDVVAPVQGVEDRSAATKMAGTAQAVSSLTQTATTVNSIFDNIKQQEASAQQSAAYESYYKALEEEAEMRRQGISSSKIANFRTEADRRAAEYIPAEDRVKFRKSVEGLGFTSALSQETPEEAYAKKLQDVAINNNLDVTQPGWQQAAANLYEIQVNGVSTISDLAVASRGSLINKGTSIYNDSSLTPQQKIAQIEMLKSQIIADAQKLSRGKVDQNELEGALGIVLDPINKMQELLTSGSQKGFIELRNLQDSQAVYDSLPAESKSALLLLDRLGPNASLLSSLLIPTSKYLSEGGLAKAASALSGTSVNISSDGGKGAIEYVEFSTKASNEGKVEDPKAIEQVNKDVEKVVTGAGYELGEMSPKEAQQIVEALAGSTGEFLLSDKSDVSPEKTAKAQQALHTHFRNKVEPIIANAVSKTSLSINPEDPNFIDMEIQGGRVVFTSETAVNEKDLLVLNRDLGSSLTTYAKALANTSGTSLEDSLEVIRGFVIPKPALEKVAPVDQTGVAQGMPADITDDVVVEGEVDTIIVNAKGTPVEEEVNETYRLIQEATNPSVKRLLENNLRNLEAEVQRSRSGSDPISTGVRSEPAAGKVGDKPPAEKAMSGETWETRAKLRAQAGVDRTTEGEVDWDFIKKREGFETKLYVPKDKDNKVLGHSGVTVGMGIDLGTWGNKLESLGVSKEVVEKLKPYAGLKGEEAGEFLEANPLELSKEEAEEVSVKVKKKLLEEIKTQFNKDSLMEFDDLTKEQQTVVASVFFQYGMDKTREGWAPKFWAQVTEGRWRDAKKNLANFGDDYPTRRRAELEYLGGL